MAVLQVMLGLDPFEFIETLEGTNGPVSSFPWVVVNALHHYSMLGTMAMHKVSYEIGATTSDEVKKWANGEVVPSEERQKQVIDALAKDLRQRYDDLASLGVHFPSARTRVPKAKGTKRVLLPVIQDVKVTSKTELDAIEKV